MGQVALVRRAWRVCIGVLAVGMAAPCLAQSVLANGVRVQAGAPLDAIIDAASRATVVHLTGDAEGDEAAGAFHDVRRDLIRSLHERAGYEVLVMPVGIFEGWWVDRQLDDPEPPESLSAWPVYRVWQQSEQFQQLVQELHRLRAAGEGIAVIGGLSRFHATGKQLYAPHLLAFFEDAGEANLSPAIRAEVERLWAGRGRLARATPEIRQEAGALAERVLGHFDAMRQSLQASSGQDRVAFERQFVANMRTFVELEQMRGGDIEPDPGFGRREKTDNLRWFLETGFPGRKLIVWEGRGDTAEELDIDVPIFAVDLSLER